MTTRIDRIAEARRRISRQRQALGEEIRAARLSAGISQGIAGRAARMSHAQFGRIERGVLPGIGLDALSRAASVVGLQLSVRVYPGGQPVRDAGHLKLLRRFRDRLPPGVTWRTEVALPANGDLRCWDGLAELAGRRAAAEAEMRLGDLQALDRRLALKRRDGGIDVVVLVVADSRWNRRVLAEHREGLRSNFELDGPEILAAFARGALPDRSGVLVL